MLFDSSSRACCACSSSVRRMWPESFLFFFFLWHFSFFDQVFIFFIVVSFDAEQNKCDVGEELAAHDINRGMCCAHVNRKHIQLICGWTKSRQIDQTVFSSNDEETAFAHFSSGRTQPTRARYWDQSKKHEIFDFIASTKNVCDNFIHVTCATFNHRPNYSYHLAYIFFFRFAVVPHSQNFIQAASG